MKEYFADLTDGTRLQININFGTLYYLQKTPGYYRVSKKFEKDPKKVSDVEKFDMAAKLIYAIVRSNGRTVNFDEALALVPPDTKQIEALLKAFQEQYQKYSKKKQAKQTMRNMGQ